MSYLYLYSCNTSKKSFIFWHLTSYLDLQSTQNPMYVKFNSWVNGEGGVDLFYLFDFSLSKFLAAFEYKFSFIFHTCFETQAND